MEKKKLQNISFRLLESVDPEGKEWDIVLIEVGRSKNGLNYSVELLKKALPLFEGAKAFAFEFSEKLFKHLPDFAKKHFPQGFAKNLVGFYDNVRFGTFTNEKGETKEGVIARFHVSEAADWLRKLLKDSWEAGKQLLGFSIDGNGLVSKTQDVEEINSISSVDVVTHPAAGGQLLRLVAGETGGKEMKDHIKLIWDFLSGKKKELLEGMDSENLTEEQEVSLAEAALEETDFLETMEKLVEAPQATLELLDQLAKLVKGEALAIVKKLIAKVKAYPKYPYPAKTRAGMSEDEKSRVDELAKKLEESEKRQERLEIKNASVLLESDLSASKLPIKMQESLRKRFSGKVFEVKDLEEAVNEQKDILASLDESGEVKGLGKGSAEVRLDEADKKQAALDKMIDPEGTVDEKFKGVGAFRGIKEAYRSITGDRDITGEIPRARLTESITVSDFPKMLEYSLNRAAVRMYPSWPSTWRNVADPIPVRDYKSFDLVKWGGFGKLPVVASKGAYQDLQQASEETVTVAGVQKRGGLVIVPEEAIRNDDLRFMQRIPRELVQAAAEGLDEDIWAPILANSAIYDLETLGNAARGNYATSALDYDSLSAAKQRMRKQRRRKTYQVAGTALGSHSTTTLQDTTKSWTVDAYIGYYVRMTYSDGAGQMLEIASNTANTLTFATGVAPIDGTKYEISAAQTLDPRMGLEIKLLAVGADLVETARTLRNSTWRPGSNIEDNIHKGTFEIVSPRTLVSATNWFGFGDKKLVPIISVTFLDGVEIPTVLLQDQKNIGQVFTNDQIRFKVKFAYNYAVEEYRNVDVNLA